ncbi:MAG: hypothetical protein IT195_09365 [Microthrixaceae bacterium]|nr:hypothetical protein [Microthrixaceae bacterium]
MKSRTWHSQTSTTAAVARRASVVANAHTTKYFEGRMNLPAARGGPS